MNIVYAQKMIDKEIKLLQRDNKKGKIPDIAFAQLRYNLYHITNELNNEGGI